MSDERDEASELPEWEGWDVGLIQGTPHLAIGFLGGRLLIVLPDFDPAKRLHQLASDDTRVGSAPGELVSVTAVRYPLADIESAMRAGFKRHDLCLSLVRVRTPEGEDVDSTLQIGMFAQGQKLPRDFADRLQAVLLGMAAPGFAGQGPRPR